MKLEAVLATGEAIGSTFGVDVADGARSEGAEGLLSLGKLTGVEAGAHASESEEGEGADEFELGVGDALRGDEELSVGLVEAVEEVSAISVRRAVIEGVGEPKREGVDAVSGRV